VICLITPKQQPNIQHILKNWFFINIFLQIQEKIANEKFALETGGAFPASIKSYFTQNG
jgi:hypothetical protein